ncbi:MAG: hypothetical protein SOY30_12575 [Eubacteriales bacterium]|nr:hypothetical protein [Eubacteriales bacterium]
MKKCSQCGRAYSDLITTCSYCGTPLGGSAPAGSGKPVPPPVRPAAQPVRSSTPPVQPAAQPVRSSTPPVQPAPAAGSTTENVGKGFLGACLFAMGGAVIQAVLINIGIVAAISGIITYFLAIYGYQKLSGIGNASSKKATWIGIPVSLLMVILGTAFGYSFYCAQYWGVSMSEAAHLIQQNSAIIDAMGEDIMSSLMLWGVSVVVSLIRGRKK